MTALNHRIVLVSLGLFACATACRPSVPSPATPAPATGGLDAALSVSAEYPEGRSLPVRLSLRNRSGGEVLLPRPRFGDSFANIDLEVRRTVASGDPVTVRRVQTELAVTDFDALKLPPGAEADFAFNLRRYFDFSANPNGDFELVARAGMDLTVEARARFAISERVRSRVSALETPVFAALTQLGLWEPEDVPASLRHEVFVTTDSDGEEALFYRIRAPGFPEWIRLTAAEALKEVRAAHARSSGDGRFHNRSFELLSSDRARMAMEKGETLFAVDGCDYVAVAALFDDGSLRLWTVGRCSPMPLLARMAGGDRGYLDRFASDVLLASDADRIVSVAADAGNVVVRFNSTDGQSRSVPVNERGPTSP